MRQPPDRAPQGRRCASSLKPRPARICAARAGAVCASMSAETLVDLARCGAGRRAVSASASRPARSVSAASTQSMRLSSPPGASWAMWPMRLERGTVSEPASGARSPAMSFRSVVLPAPLRPTRPTLWPVGIPAVAPSRIGLPSMRKLRSLMCSMSGGDSGSRAAVTRRRSERDPSVQKRDHRQVAATVRAAEATGWRRTATRAQQQRQRDEKRQRRQDEPKDAVERRATFSASPVSR